MWTDTFKKNFIGMLENNEVEVIFTKVNGEERTMRCTLMPSAFQDYKFVSSQKKYHPDVCSVWDLDEKNWRSFRFESIKKFSLTIE